ncbi:hypothetical protein BLNAU_21350 [Blattamonas nauphoetae]|uniref:Protein kinase domain-containing protein n=1 Tax=Blattamonas nauphoetae TaxID=2049346 RepID=A0ABQ9WW77_9EUKA|nr:hypothetical protein BLNAU_21350 [Blattamonas nauphoetae]
MLNGEDSLTSAVTLEATSMSVSNCSFEVSSSLPPFVIHSGTDLHHTTPCSVVITHSHFINHDHQLPAIVLMDTSSKHTSESEIALLSTTFSSSLLTGRNGLLFDVTNKNGQSHLKTTIAAVSLTNMTSSPSPQRLESLSLFQTLLSSSLTLCTNHLSGTATRDFNLGGSLLCQNTTFKTCLADPSIPSVDAPSQNHFVGRTIGTTQYFTSVSSGSIAFVKCSLSNFESTEQGEYSALGISTSSLSCDFVLSECVFEHFSSSSATGARIYGAVSIHGASQTVMSVLVYKCKFNDCSVSSADAAAGAVYAVQGASITVTETNFTSCTSSGSTGALYIHMISTTAVSNCEFVECSAGMYAGAARFTTQMSYVLSSSLFLSCSSGNNGAGFDSSGSISTAQVLLTIFRNCSSGNNGGGFYQTFNPSTTSGYTPAFTFSLENCTFDNCTAGGAGGGCFVSDQTTDFLTVVATLSEVIAVNCKAKQGAGILIRDMKSVSIEKSSFTSCESSDRGTIRVFNLMSSSIKTSNFIDCVCTGEEGGGGIVIDTEDSSVIDECQFVDLSSKGPGTAVQISKVATVTVTNSSFSGCSSSKNGGAIWTSGITTTLTLKTSKITNCESKGSGGGIAFVLTAESVALNLEMSSVAFGTVAEGTENTCEGLGSDVFVEFRSTVNNTFLQRVSTALFPTSPTDGIAFTRSQRLSAAFAENATVYTARCSVLVHSNPYSNGALTIDSENGLDEELCGVSTVPCETLTRGVDMIAAGQTLRIRSTASLAQIVTVWKEMTWTHAEATTGSVSAKTGGSISVASGQLNLVKIEFSSEANVKLTTSLLVVSSGSLSVTSCSFNKISSSADGSCISATLSANSLSIAVTAFKTCSSDGSGGAVFVSCGSTVMASQLSVKASFEGCSCGATGSGKWVFVEGYTFVSLIVSSSWSITPQLSNPADIANLWGTDLNEPTESNYSSVSLLLYLTKYEATTVEIGSGGRDLAGCGSSQWRCEKFAVASSHLAGVGIHTLSIADSVSLSEPLSFSTNDITMSSPTPATVSVSSAATISISGFTLTLSSLIFDGLSQDRSTAFISLAATGTVSMSACSFTKLTRSSGNGAVFSVSLSSSNSLNLNTVHFSKCESEKGGPLFVDVSGSTAADRVTFVGVTFGTGSDKNVGTPGNNLYLKCSSMSSATKTGIVSLSPTLPATKDTTDDILNDFVGIDSSNAEVSLLLIWNAHKSGDVNVLTSGHSHANCGKVQLPCSSLAQGHLSVKPSGNTIVLADDQTLSTPLTITQSQETIKSDVGVRKVTIESSGSIILTQAASTLTLLNLLFVIDATLPPPIFISVSAGRLAITSCAFGESSTPSTLTQSLMSVSGGSLSLLSCTLDSFTVNQISLISLNAGSLSLADCNVTGIVGSSDSSLSSNGAGRTLTLNIGSDEIASFGSDLSPVTFEECSSDGDGGVISASVKGTGILSLNDAIFVSCESTGRGGALYISCASEVTSSQLSIKATFETCSCGDSSKGEWVFVEGSSLNSFIVPSSWSLTNTFTSPDDFAVMWGTDSSEPTSSNFSSVSLLLFLSFYQAATIELGTAGRDILGCGSETWKCQTLDCTIVAFRHVVSIDHDCGTVSDSLDSTTPLITVEKGSLNLKDIGVLECPAVELIRAEDCTVVSFQWCEFDGPDTPLITEMSNTDSVCSWDTGMISLVRCNTSFKQCAFSDLPHGALHLAEGETELVRCEFFNNTVSHPSFPSLRRNVRCVSGSLSVVSLVGGDGVEDSPSAWFSIEDECSLSSSVVNVLSPFVVPSLSDKSTSTLSNVGKKYSIDVKGLLLIPCDVRIELFENVSVSKTEFRDGNSFLVDLNETSILNLTETQFSFSVAHSQLLKTLNGTHEWRARLNFGQNQTTPNSILVKVDAATERKAQAKAAMSFIIPIVAGVLAFLLILIIIIVLIRRRQKKKAAMPKNNPETQELDNVLVKDDDFLENHVTLGTTAFVFDDVASEDKAKNLIHASVEPDAADDLCVREQNTAGEVAKLTTLYDLLHKPQGVVLNRNDIKAAVVRALRELTMSQPTSELLTRLTPHVVLLNGRMEVEIKEKERTGPKQSGENTTLNQSAVKEEGNEGQRWEAPEVGEGNEGFQKEVDVVAASVFSLGLLLTEIDTGQVPFAEMDAVNAHRMLGTGSHPKMEGMEDDMKELVKKCLALDPTERPNLDTIEQTLNSIKPKAGEPSNNNRAFALS